MKIANSTSRFLNLPGNIPLVGTLAVLFLALVVPPFASAALTDSFDAPLKKKVVDYEPSPYYERSRVRVKLSCYFYSTFMVKEYDLGQQGAEWLAIIPTEKEMASPCNRSHTRGERVIEGTEWSGYFEGAKGHLAFFRGDDGYNGGLPFAIYDSRTGTKVFEDSIILDSHFNQWRFNSTQGGQFSLNYLRVVQAECDLHTGKAACWESVRKKFDLRNMHIPVCTGYEGLIGTDAASAIAYPVEVLLFPHPVVKTADGPVRCWPAD